MVAEASRVKRRRDGVGYQLGVDIGTTHTAAAVLRQGRAEMVTLGDDSDVIPSVVFLAADEQVIVGEAASEHGFSDPDRVARAFRRRLGEPTPIVLGGTPYSVDHLMAKLLREVVATVSEREEGAPDLVTVTHPANWGAYRTDLLRESITQAGLESFRTLSDPEAAAIFHASEADTAEGDLVVVYDLGGGTFDASVARRTPDGFEMVGLAEGIDRLGGIDFDEAVLAHISGAVGVNPQDFKPGDPATIGALARLRDECAVVKEALSTATEVAVPVFLPGGEKEVRVTRDDLEAMVRPRLTETIAVLHRTLETADVEAADVDAVLLVGGSSCIPLVAQLVSEELGRAVTVADQPTHAVALGAALSMVAWAEEHDPAPPDGPDEAEPTEEADEAKEATEDAEADSHPGPDMDPPPDAAAEKPSAPPMSLLMSLAAVAVALAMIGMAVAAGTLVAVGQVAAGVALIALVVAAGLALFLMVRRAATTDSETSETTEPRQGSSL